MVFCTCGCGRLFLSQASLKRHQENQAMSASASGTGNAIETITSTSLKLCGSEPSISSSDAYDLICSYNWVNKEQPTVYVPGETF